MTNTTILYIITNTRGLNILSFITVSYDNIGKHGTSWHHAVVKVVLWRGGGALTWRSKVGANPIPIPTLLIWRYLGLKWHFIHSIRGSLTIAGGLKWEQGGGLPRAPSPHFNRWHHGRINPDQRWTWVGSIHGLGWVGLWMRSSVIFSLHFVFVIVLCAKKICK